VEKETFKHADRKLILSLKTGWEYQVTPPTITASALDLIVDKVYGAFKFKHPAQDAAIVSLNALQRLDHWSIVGSYSVRFNKNLSAHGLTGGVEYAF
jgi:hypothetical protein